MSNFVRKCFFPLVLQEVVFGMMPFCSMSAGTDFNKIWMWDILVTTGEVLFFPFIIGVNTKYEKQTYKTCHKKTNL